MFSGREAMDSHDYNNKVQDIFKTQHKSNQEGKLSHCSPALLTPVHCNVPARPLELGLGLKP